MRKEALGPPNVYGELEPLSWLPPDLRRHVQGQIFVWYFEEPNLFEEIFPLYRLAHGTAFPPLISWKGWREFYTGMQAGGYPLGLLVEAMGDPTRQFTGVLPYVFSLMEGEADFPYEIGWVQPALVTAVVYIFWRAVLAFQQQRMRGMDSDLPPFDLTIDQTLMGGVAAWLGKEPRQVPYRPISEWLRRVLGKLYFSMVVRHIATSGAAITLEEGHERVIERLLGEGARSVLDLANWRQSERLRKLGPFKETFGFGFKHTWGEILKELVNGGFMPQIVETLAGFEQSGDPNLKPWARLIKFESQIGMGFLDFLSTLPDEVLLYLQGPFKPNAPNSELAFIECARSGNLNCKFLLLAYVLNQITVVFTPSTLPRVGFRTGRPANTLRPAMVLPLTGVDGVDIYIPRQLRSIIGALFNTTFYEFARLFLHPLIVGAYQPEGWVGRAVTVGEGWQCSANYGNRGSPFSPQTVLVPQMG